MHDTTLVKGGDYKILVRANDHNKIECVLIDALNSDFIKHVDDRHVVDMLDMPINVPDLFKKV